jgi:hypothetical protein
VLVALDRAGAVAGFASTIDGPGGCLTLVELYVARSRRRRGSALVAASDIATFAVALKVPAVVGGGGMTQAV